MPPLLSGVSARYPAGRVLSKGKPNPTATPQEAPGRAGPLVALPVGLRFRGGVW